MSLDAARSLAARVAARADLRDIRLWSIESQLRSVPDERVSRLSYTLNSALDVHYSQDDAILIVRGNYSLEVAAAPINEIGEPNEPLVGGGQDVEAVATLSFRQEALFGVDGEPEESPFTESELNAFGETTGQFALYPYARELVAELTGKMGLPRLHLPVMRLNLETRTG